MKHIFVFAILIFISSINGSSQTFYVIGGGGYDLANSVNETEAKNQIYGFGSIGYALSTRIELEIGINNYSLNNAGDDGGMIFFVTSLEMIRLMPVVKLKFTKSFYVKAGFSIGVGANTLIKSWAYNDVPPYDSSGLEVKYSGGVSPGFTFAVGKDIRLNEASNFHTFMLNFEFVTTYNSWTPTHATILEFYGRQPYVIDNPHSNYLTIAIQVGLKYTIL